MPHVFVAERTTSTAVAGTNCRVPESNSVRKLRELSATLYIYWKTGDFIQVKQAATHGPMQ